MSRPESPDPFDLAAAIDRLVADELGTDDRRALLARLESTPDGWRRCALAFLEDQAWRSALARPAIESVPPPIAQPSTRPHRGKAGVRVGAYALAACLFALLAQVCFRAGVGSVKPQVLPEVTSTPPQLAPRPDPGPPPGQPLGWASLVDPSEGEALPRQVPILAATASNEKWLQEQPATIPDYVRAQWERRGFQIEERRRLVGLDLKDGRRVAIPVDEVAVDYVGRQPL